IRGSLFFSRCGGGYQHTLSEFPLFRHPSAAFGIDHGS
ncbi:MAG: hypothetical protein RIS89_491, partial [Bacteroidota bacterium]